MQRRSSLHTRPHTRRPGKHTVLDSSPLRRSAKKTDNVREVVKETGRPHKALLSYIPQRQAIYLQTFLVGLAHEEKGKASLATALLVFRTIEYLAST